MQNKEKAGREPIPASKLDEIISCIQLAYRHFCRPFTFAEYKAFANENGLVGYDYALYHSRMTWRELLKLAGVPAAKRGPGSTRMLTRDDILDYIIKAAQILGHFPTFKEYREIAAEYKFPCRRTVLRFGAWTGLLKSAQQRLLGGQHETNTSIFTGSDD